MTTITFQNVYVTSRGCAVGPLEASGPLKGKFDICFDDLYCNEKSFEKAEQKLLYSAIDATMRKSKVVMKDVDLLCGGDLLNQLLSSHYVARDFHHPFLGMYAACATSSALIGQAAIWVEHGYAQYALAFTSSHVATAERQFRYPNEYGIQKKETTTSTVTGAGAILLSNKPGNLKVTAFTPGEIVDWQHTDANDMGLAMAPAVFSTLTKHLKDTNRTMQDYDCIVSGDLSEIGFSFLMDLLVKDGYDIDDRFNDCGLLIYDRKKQHVFCGGSGCACSMVVTIAHLLQLLEEGVYHRILVIASGALLSPVALQQKDTIPCIAHAIVYERGDV